MNALALRSALSDFYGLDQLGRGVIPDIAETLRRIFIAERQSDHRRPDHFYKSFSDQRLGPAGNVAQLPSMVLSQLADEYLERRDGRIVVRYERFSEWHELLPQISPLCVLVAFLVAEKRGPALGNDPRDFLAAEIGESALPAPADLHLSDLVERSGLYELHMHLNGSTELDVLWNAAVADPDAFYREIDAASKDNGAMASELYDQLQLALTPHAVYQRLRASRRVRWRIVEEIKSARRRSDEPTPGAPAMLDGIVEAMREDASDRSIDAFGGLPLSTDPIARLHGASDHRPIIQEAAWLYVSLQHLSIHPDDRVVGTGLYFNLLTLSLVRRLSVQQSDEYGFDQFQKYTMAGTREGLERSYVARFRQLNLRKPYDLLAHVEGRFSPKDTARDGRALVGRIVGDFQRFAGCGRRDELDPLPEVPPPCLTSAGCPGLPCASHGRRLAELSLVGHFIKRPPNRRSDAAAGYRDSGIRARTERQARVLRRLLANGTVASVVRGVDAAANELHAGPEPFAPAYRIARRAGLDKATFHAGEDFRHIVSGMRAVVEAMTFLDLRAGDRIGHATAIGINPALWQARAGPRVLLKRTDLLDDAVFAHRLLVGRHGYADEVARLADMIATESTRVFGETLSAGLLEQEWRLRSMDPLSGMKVWQLVEGRLGIPHGEVAIEAARHLSRTAIDDEMEAEFKHVAALLERHGEAFELFRRRHRLMEKERSDWVETDVNLLSAGACTALQDQILADVNSRGIALEALPTSNLRISHYHRLEEHHIFRWLGLEGPSLANLPTVIIGSDDPGIFATNLRNEFAAVAAVLRDKFDMSADEAAGWLHRLNDAARIRRFRPGDPA